MVVGVKYTNSVGAPTSLDIEFFEEVLEGALLEANVELKTVSLEMGCPGGENYCSKIYRAKITFQCEGESPSDISVIIKNIAPSETIQFLEDLKFFLKEKIAYSVMLPRMEILLDEVKLGPKLYYSRKEPTNILVFEDLSVLGYVMADRVVGLDIDHCKMVMKKIGQFHATSMIMQKKEPESMKLFQHGILSEKGVNGSDFYELHFGNCVQGLIELISKWEGFEAITEKVKRYRANFKENLIKSQQPIAGELKVLNHGDLWVNNILFKYNDDSRQEVVDAVFVDLQLGIYGSPGYDLNYFLYSSAQLDVQMDKREEILRTYHTALSDTLQIHSYEDIPSFGDILTEVRRREFFGFFANSAILPGIALDKRQSGDTSLDKFIDEDFGRKIREMMFSSKRVQDTMRYNLRRFDEMGILD